MRKTLSLLIACAGLSLGAPVITVIPSIGPSGLGPSAGTYNQNALNALQNSLASVGSGAATYNRLVGNAFANQLIETTFNSWLGVTPGPFSGELGNNLYFGVSIVDNSGKFSLSQLVYSDNFGTYEPSLVGTSPFSFNGDTYNTSTMIAIDFGPDNVLGGGNDTVITNGTSGSTQVNLLIYRGVSGFFLPLVGSFANDQARLNATASAIGGGLPLTLTGGYCIAAQAGATNCSPVSASVGVVPEPSTYALFGAG